MAKGDPSLGSRAGANPPVPLLRRGKGDGAANPKHVAVVKQGAKAIEAWCKEHPDERLDLSEADLTRANLTDADLEGADLYRTMLFGANLSGAVFEATTVAACDMSRCQGLESVRHDGPSSIGEAPKKKRGSRGRQDAVLHLSPRSNESTGKEPGSRGRP